MVFASVNSWFVQLLGKKKLLDILCDLFCPFCLPWYHKWRLQSHWTSALWDHCPFTFVAELFWLVESVKQRLLLVSRLNTRHQEGTTWTASILQNNYSRMDRWIYYDRFRVSLKTPQSETNEGPSHLRLVWTAACFTAGKKRVGYLQVAGGHSQQLSDVC